MPDKTVDYNNGEIKIGFSGLSWEQAILNKLA
jgi:hypothetical protein